LIGAKCLGIDFNPTSKYNIKMKINKSKLKVGYIFEGSEGSDEIVVYIDKDDGMVYCRHLEEDGNRYKIERDGSIKV
jgi:hypothetical protein